MIVNLQKTREELAESCSRDPPKRGIVYRRRKLHGKTRTMVILRNGSQIETSSVHLKDMNCKKI